jgi:hypothetical protein
MAGLNFAVVSFLEIITIWPVGDSRPMKMRRTFLIAILLAVASLVILFFLAPKHPLAIIHVIDAAGNPVSGAVIKADGLRTKPGPYAHAHYGWPAASNGVPNVPVITSRKGVARVPYPKYASERLETGQISFSVDHPEFVPDRPFRTVTITPPSGAPWRVWLTHLLERIRFKAQAAAADPVILQRGATVKLAVRGHAIDVAQGRLVAQGSGSSWVATNFWLTPEPGVILTRRLAAGTQTVRAVWFDAGRRPWFTDVVTVMAISGQTQELTLDLKPGVTVSGKLDDVVPRPVVNGRMVARVTPVGHRLRDSPPLWHGWSPVAEDGTFKVHGLPAGDLEVVALCQRFVSTNGPGQFRTRYPQRHLLGSNDVEIVIGMERTAALQVQVTDEQGRAIRGARVATWPNVRYGEWSSTILLSDCYNSSDLYLDGAASRSDWSSMSRKVEGDFEATTDGSGTAVVPNLPVTVQSFAVYHADYVLPSKVTPGGDKQRYATVNLTAGETNTTSVQLERSGRSPIAHY